MDNDMKWIVGILVALAGLTGGIVTRDRQMAKAIKDGDDNLHQRINKVRENYVRRDDLDGHIERLDANVRELKEDMKEHNREVNRRLDTIMTAVTSESQHK